MRGVAAAWVVFGWGALFAAPAAGQSHAAAERLIVLRTTAGAEVPGLASAADGVESALRDAHTTLSTSQVAALLGQRHSTEPAAASQDDFDLLARESDEALEHVAFGRRRQAREAIEVILERAQLAIEALNRESRSARRVQNSCLYLVRSLADASDEEAALNQAVECARLVPDMRPSAAEHPPAVRHLYDRAVERIESGPHGSLRVESEPSGCDVYLNGRRLGATPFVREQLPTGEYRIQVECEAGRPGRVHRVILAAEPREVLIEARFDRTLRSTSGDVRLEYEDADTENAHRLEDASRVAQILDASALLLVSAESPEVARIDWVQMPDQVLASARVSIGPSGVAPESLARAVDALGGGRSVDATGTEDQEMAAWVPPAAQTAGTGGATGPHDRGDPSEGGGAGDDDGGGGASTVGWILGGVGVATFGAAWGVQGVWFSRRDQASVAEPTDPDYQDRIDRRDAMVLPVALLGAGAALVTTAALPFLVGDDGAAWWHWVLGGAGVVVAGVGIAFWAQEGSCTDALCSDRNRTVPLAPLLVSMAVPLLAVPIMALIMKSGEDAPPNDLTLLPTVGPEGAGLVLGGTL